MKSFKEVYKDSGLGKWFGKGGKGGTSKGGWDRYNTKGEKIGKCGDSKLEKVNLSVYLRQRQGSYGHRVVKKQLQMLFVERNHKIHNRIDPNW